MSKHIDLFNSTYSHFYEQVLAAVRKETFGEDIGQNSWTTADEYDRFISLLNISQSHHILEVACGSGGPAIYLSQKTGCRVTGIDANEKGIAAAKEAAAKYDPDNKLIFLLADADKPLPFENDSFEALVCIDSMNHFPSRMNVFCEWYRVLRPGGRALFTDPVVITGPVTNEELASRSSIGLFLFVPPHINQQFIVGAGFQLIREEDVSENASLTSNRWRAARDRHKKELLLIEGEERYEGLQKFFNTVYKLTDEKRLSRVLYLTEKK